MIKSKQYCVRTAIVLDNPLGSSRICVYDVREGKRDVRVPEPFKKKCARGSLITYALNPEKREYVAQDPELVAFPQDWARLNVYFLHMWIELCQKLMPYGQALPELHEFLYGFYAYPAPYPLSKAIYLLVLARFLVLCGIYPESAVHLESRLEDYLISGSLDIILRADADSFSLRVLERFVQDSLYTHPLACRDLKAHYFLTRLDCNE